MEPSEVYRIVRIPKWKYMNVLQRQEPLSKREPKQTGHHSKTPQASDSCKTTLVSDRYDITHSRTVCETSRSSIYYKGALTSDYRKTVSDHCNKIPGNHQHHTNIPPSLPVNSCLNSSRSSRRAWRWLYIAVVLALGRPVLSQKTSWVYQSHTPFTIQKDFQKFVEEAGGNSRRFKFYGNFFESDENEQENDRFLENSFLEMPFQNDKKPFANDFTPAVPLKNFQKNILLAKPALKQALHEPLLVDRVPKSFYEDIFDHSLPVDSPYRTSFSSGPKPGRLKSHNENKRVRTNRKLKRPQKGLISNSFQPFSSDLLTPLPFQKHTNIEGFVSQTLGNIEFSKRQSKSAFDTFPQFSDSGHKVLGAFSDEIRSTENEVSRVGFLLKRRPFFGGPRRPPRKLFRGELKPVFSHETSQHEPPVLLSEDKPPTPSSHTVSHLNKPNFDTIVSDHHTSGNGHVGGTSDSKPFGQSIVKRPLGGGSRGKAVGVLSSKPTASPAGVEQSIVTSGCPSETDGILYGAGSVWFERGCQRHTCVHFRGRFFVETDSCVTEIHNTSYRCVVLADTEASYPDCCPRYQCHPDNLGRPGLAQDTGS